MRAVEEIKEKRIGKTGGRNGRRNAEREEIIQRYHHEPPSSSKAQECTTAFLYHTSDRRMVRLRLVLRPFKKEQRVIC